MKIKPALITLSSDFGVQSQGIGTMEATIFDISPETRVIHLMHGLPEFDLIAAARTMETVRYLPIGIHICVCDPGVGTSRKGIALRTKRGDYFVGPDNGIFGPASRLLGGLEAAHQLSNPNYMRLPVSPLFHGRGVFAPAAAHLANGVALADFGAQIDFAQLAAPPYQEATIIGNTIRAQVIQINRFGSAHLNILHEQWDSLEIELGARILIQAPGDRTIEVQFTQTFGDVAQGSAVILRDDYGRIELARNRASFVAIAALSIGAEVTVLF